MKESIGDGQVKTPVPDRLRTLRSKRQDILLKDLFDIEPSKLFHDAVDALHLYAKTPHRVKMKLKQESSCLPGRFLSFEEIAIVERKMLLEGEDINPKFCNMEENMNKKVDLRLAKLYEVIGRYVADRKYFQSSMLKGGNVFDEENRKYLTTEDEKYLNRNIRDDLNRLRKKGLIYSRGRPPSWYLGQDKSEDLSPEQEAEEKDMSMIKFLIPETITLNINVNFGSLKDR